MTTAVEHRDRHHDRQRERYRRDGFLAPIRVVDEATALEQRTRFEWAESQLGPLHYRGKMHLILTSVWQLVTQPVLLDAVEACIGPDILLYDSTYIVKEPHSPAKVNWHQDLTYWGLSDDDAQVSAWIALSAATPDSGCMRMVPGSHRSGMIRHHVPDRKPDDDVLDLGQYIEMTDESTAVHVPLAPGEASLHHGWTVHASSPNVSDDRRIGLNVQFVAPHCRQTMHDDDSAILVRGTDEYGHFRPEQAATTDLDPAALALQRAGHERIRSTYTEVRDS